jgi:hypothetical protein
MPSAGLLYGRNAKLSESHRHHRQTLESTVAPS